MSETQNATAEQAAPAPRPNRPARPAAPAPVVEAAEPAPAAPEPEGVSVVKTQAGLTLVTF